MALRLIEIYHKQGKADEIEFLLKDLPMLDTWHDHLPENETITKILIRSEHIDEVLNILDSYYIEDKSFRVIIMNVEATVPRPEEPPQEEEPESVEKEGQIEKSTGRISTEELYQKLIGISGISQKNLMLTILAAFVAAIGLLKNDVAIIIGSMVIAPLLSPYMGLSLATTLADAKLARKAIPTILVGSVLALAVGILCGLFINVDPTIPQIASRSNVSHYYIFLALASGVAGAFSISTGVAEVLVGVMVAVALLPPLVATGLLFGGAYWVEGIGSFLLFGVNAVCINLSGVVTLVLEGIRPMKWWEAAKAKKAVRISISIWIVFLIILVFMIYIEQHLQSIAIP